MLGSSLTVTMDGSGGTAKVLPLINQDGYSSEYRLDDTTVIYSAKVRHSSDNVKVGTQKFDRHTVTFGLFVKPTDVIPLGRLTEIIYTIRVDPALGVGAYVISLSDAMSYYMVSAGAKAAKLLGWES